MTSYEDSVTTSVAAPLFDLEAPGYFTSIAGNTNARYVPFTDAAKHIYQQILGILDHFGIEYFVFAGTLVGYVRNGRMPPWMDDIDIMIFGDNITLFEEKVAPYMLACGFNCKPAANKLTGGGYHILALQQSTKRSDAIPFADTEDISVPWAQIDVFFSTVDEKNMVRNLKAWGLYHRKDVPFDWVMPPQEISMNGMTFKTFSNIEADVLQEYGDVRNELVVHTHGKVFLRAPKLEWDIFDREFNRLVETTVSQLTPNLSQDAYAGYSSVPGKKCQPDKTANFDEIMVQIVQENAGAVLLQGEEQTFWVMDIKRLAPELQVCVHLSSLEGAKRAAHLRAYIDEVETSDPDLQAKYDETIAALTAALGS